MYLLVSKDIFGLLNISKSLPVQSMYRYNSFTDFCECIFLRACQSPLLPSPPHTFPPPQPYMFMVTLRLILLIWDNSPKQETDWGQLCMKRGFLSGENRHQADILLHVTVGVTVGGYLNVSIEHLLIFKCAMSKLSWV